MAEVMAGNAVVKRWLLTVGCECLLITLKSHGRLEGLTVYPHLGHRSPVTMR